MATGTPFSPTPFSSTVVAPQTASVFRRASYIYPAEYRFAPTAVSTANLVAGSTNQQPDSLNALALVLERASSWVDLICFHRPEGTLAASITTESAWIKAKPHGTLVLTCNVKPVLEVTAPGLGATPAPTADVTPDT